MATKRHFSKGIIYHAKRGQIYDPDRPRYNCYSPADDFDCTVFDAWVCDVFGNIHPGYNNSPVPVRDDQIGHEVGRM